MSSRFFFITHVAGPLGLVLYGVMALLLGFLNLILGVVGLLLMQRYGLGRQTWILRLVIVLSLLAYVGPIAFDNTVGSIGFFEIVEHVLFVLMLLSGVMMLRARDAIEPA